MIPGGKTGSVAALTATFATAVTLTGGVNRGPISGIWFNGLATWRTYKIKVKIHMNKFIKLIFRRN